MIKLIEYSLRMDEIMVDEEVDEKVDDSVEEEREYPF